MNKTPIILRGAKCLCYTLLYNFRYPSLKICIVFLQVLLNSELKASKLKILSAPWRITLAKINSCEYTSDEEKINNNDFFSENICRNNKIKTKNALLQKNNFFSWRTQGMFFINMNHGKRRSFIYSGLTFDFYQMHISFTLALFSTALIQHSLPAVFAAVC